MKKQVMLLVFSFGLIVPWLMAVFLLPSNHFFHNLFYGICAGHLFGKMSLWMYAKCCKETLEE